MPVDRTNIIRGPAIISFDSAVIYTEGDITLTPTIETFKIASSIHGEADERLDSIVTEISFTPSGQWVSAALSALFPYANPTIGASVFGSTDKNVVIQTLAGQQITWKAGAITGMPDIILSANKTPLGAVTITCIGANNTAWSDAAKHAVIASQAFGDTSFDPTKIFTVPYTAAWGASAPWNAISTEEGWTLSFDLSLEDVTTDAEAIVDKTIGSVGVLAKCVPVGITEAQLLALIKLQGTGIARGVSLGANANDLVIEGANTGEPKVSVFNAAPKESGFRFGQTVLRSGELGFVGVASFTSGARTPIFEVGTVPSP